MSRSYPATGEMAVGQLPRNCTHNLTGAIMFGESRAVVIKRALRIGAVTAVLAGGQLLVEDSTAFGPDMFNYTRDIDGEKGHTGNSSFQGTSNWSLSESWDCANEDTHDNYMMSAWVGDTDWHGHYSCLE